MRNHRGGKTLKLTAIGNLPRAVVHEIYKLGIRESYFDKDMARLRKETDWYTVPDSAFWQKAGRAC